MSEVARRLGAIEARIERWPFVITAAAIIVLSIIKHGFTYVQMFEDRFFTETPAALEYPDIIFARSLFLTRVFNLDDRLSYQVFSALASVAVLVVTSWLLHRRLPKKAALVAFAAICLGQVGLMSIGQFGREDTWLILGAALLILSGKRSWVAWIAGSVVMALANPGQAVVGTLLMLAIATTPRFKAFRKRVAMATGITSVWMLLVYLQQSGNQVDAFGTFWLTGVNGFLVNGPLRAYSIYGILWLGVLGLILASRRASAAVYLGALIAAPILIVLLTGDGTRVGVGVTVVMVLSLLVIGSEPLLRWFTQRIGPFALTSAILVLFIAPTLNIYEFDLVMPWEWMKYAVGDWIVLSPTDN